MIKNAPTNRDLAQRSTITSRVGGQKTEEKPPKVKEKTKGAVKSTQPKAKEAETDVDT